MQGAIDCIERRWEDTDEGRAELRARHFFTTPSQELFARLEVELDTALSGKRLAAFANDAALLARLDHAAIEARQTVNTFLEGALGTGTNRRLVEFIQSELAPEVAGRFNAILYGEDKQSTAAWRAFERLLLNTVLTSRAASGAELLDAREAVKEELA